MKNKRALVVGLLLFLLWACVDSRIDSALQRAEEFSGTRKFEEALQVYKSIALRYPDHPKAAVSLLKTADLYYYQLKDTKEALSFYSEIISRWPYAEESCTASLKKGEIFRASGEFRKAIAALEWGRHHFPSSPGRFGAVLQIAELYLNLNDPYQASVELEALLKIEDLGPEIRAKALYDLAESYLFLKKYEKALAYFSTATKEFPEAPYLREAELRKAECLEKLKQ